MFFITALIMLFGIFLASACNCAYAKVTSGTVPGAVATGSVAPGRYRSRYRTDCRTVYETVYENDGVRGIHQALHVVNKATSIAFNHCPRHGGMLCCAGYATSPSLH